MVFLISISIFCTTIILTWSWIMIRMSTPKTTINIFFVNYISIKMFRNARGYFVMNLDFIEDM